MTGPTPSQTIGPFFAVAMPWLEASTTGDVVVHGQVLDGEGRPVDDAMLEIWHADPDGTLEPGVFGRACTDDDGSFSLQTTRPGRVDDRQAPHIDVSVFARGLLQRVVTRIYFEDDCDLADPSDPVLALVDPARRPTLVARREGDAYRFDVHLQGGEETVFFAW